MKTKDGKALSAGNELFRAVFNAIMDWSFIVDSEVRIVDFNTQAQQGLGKDSDTLLYALGGQALNCQHAIESGGECGVAKQCKNCGIRMAVNRALRKGRAVRSTTKMILFGSHGFTQVDLQLTATPFHYQDQEYVLLMFQNITASVNQQFIPVCSNCLNVRKDHDKWIPMNTFLATLPGINISHSICPHCREELYGKRLRDGRKNGKQKAEVQQAESPAQAIMQTS